MEQVVYYPGTCNGEVTASHNLSLPLCKTLQFIIMTNNLADLGYNIGITMV